MIMQVNITGSSGFLGQNFKHYLSNLYYVKKFITRDELERGVDFDDCDVFVHLVGKAHDLKKKSNPDEYFKVNFEITRDLYDKFLLSKAKKFIFISSVKAAADSIKGILTEDVVPNPQTDYGRSKLMAEQYIANQPLPDGKSYYILRPCMIHGPLNKGNLNLLFKFVQKGVPYPLSAFKNKRSFLSVQNLCFVINELIINNSIISGVYNVSDDEPLSTNEVVSIIAESLNKKQRLWKFPRQLVTMAAKIGNMFHLPLNTERLQKLTESYIVSNKKIKIAINKELPVSARKGLEATVKSFQLR